MRRGPFENTTWRLLTTFGTAALLAFAPACGSSEDAGSLGNGAGNGNGNGNGQPGAEEQKTPEEQIKQILDARVLDYAEAARTAKLKLVDELPTMEEIKAIESAADVAAKKVAYEALIDKWIADPKFVGQMVKFWKDTLRTGQVGTVQMGAPDKDKAALFAAQVVTSDRPYTDIFTAAADTCPTFDAATNTFTAGSCGTTVTSGVITDPGIQAQYFSNMAFRRVRFLQETFACSKFPAEYSDQPVAMGNGTYTGKLDFSKLVGKQSATAPRVDFQDTSAVICANCHSTMNRIAPLFLNYGDDGLDQGTPQVEVPIPGNPKAKPEDYLVTGTPLAWRADKVITDIPSLGQAIASDPAVARCAVNRVWNYAFSRGDIVNDLAAVPENVTQPLVDGFTANGQKLKETIRAVFKAEDFVRF